MSLWGQTAIIAAAASLFFFDNTIVAIERVRDWHTISGFLNIFFAVFLVAPALTLKGRHILGGVYAVDKQLQLQPDGSVQVDEETEQRLKHSLHDFVEAVNRNRLPLDGKVYAELNR